MAGLGKMDEEFKVEDDTPSDLTANVSAFQSSIYAVIQQSGNPPGIEGGFHFTAGCVQPNQ